MFIIQQINLANSVNIKGADYDRKERITAQIDIMVDQWKTLQAQSALVKHTLGTLQVHMNAIEQAENKAKMEKMAEKPPEDTQ